MLQLRFARENVETDAFDARRGAGEVLVHQLLVQPDGFEDLRAAIALQRRDAHLREGLQQAFVDGLDVMLHRFLERTPRQISAHARSSSVSSAR